jgi:manganese-dependent inorganic pyrophosphatase
MEKAYKDHGVEMLFFMLTNILQESTELLFQGNGSKEVVENAFNISNAEEKIILKGVVSRKKQLIPLLMMSLQQDNN